MFSPQHYKLNNELFIRPDHQQGVLLRDDVSGLLAYKASKRRFNQLNNIDQLVSLVDQLQERIAKLEASQNNDSKN